jgi:hypothetical protein
MPSQQKFPIEIYLIGNGTRFTWFAASQTEFVWSVATLNEMNQLGNVGTAARPSYALPVGQWRDFSQARRKWQNSAVTR